MIKAAKKKKEAASASVTDARLYDVIIAPVVTEKSTAALEQNKMVFKVRPDATKPRIKQAVEQIFGVSVVAVNTTTLHGKTKRFRGTIGVRSDVKKAVVTLKKGDHIDVSAKV
jgi:large subunit ribosomal protein L23